MNIFAHTVPILHFWNPHSGFGGGIIMSLVIVGTLSIVFRWWVARQRFLASVKKSQDNNS